MFRAEKTAKEPFVEDLRTHIHQHVETVQTIFNELDLDVLNQQPAPDEWSVLQCFDHLNLTHDYYRPKIETAMTRAVGSGPADADVYIPSFWGRIYMYFSFNPKNSFPTADAITPDTVSSLGRAVLDDYIARQETLLETLGQVERVDLARTRVPLELFVGFNLGDCLKVLVYHDELHIGQAQRALEALGG